MHGAYICLDIKPYRMVKSLTEEINHMKVTIVSVADRRVTDQIDVLPDGEQQGHE